MLEGDNWSWYRVSVIGELWRSLSSEGKRQILCKIGRSVRKGEWQEGYFAGRGLPKCVLLGGEKKGTTQKRGKNKQTNKNLVIDELVPHVPFKFYRSLEMEMERETDFL